MTERVLMTYVGRMTGITGLAVPPRQMKTKPRGGRVRRPSLR